MKSLSMLAAMGIAASAAFAATEEPSLTYDAPFPGSDTGRIYYFVPKGLDLSKSAPLLVFMHGGNRKSPDNSPEKKYIIGTSGRARPHGWTGVSFARSADELMTRYGVEHVYAEHPDGHSIGGDGEKEATRRFMEWTKDKRRAPYARKTALVTPVGSWHPSAEPVAKARWLELVESTAA